MTKTPLTTLRGFLADEHGFGAMELALAMPFLMLLCLGMMDASMLLGTKIDYEQAAQRTTDLAFARRPNSDDGREYNWYVTEAKTAADVEADAVDVDIFLECDGVRQSDFNGQCASGEVSNRFVSVSISNQVDTQFDWAGLAGLIGFTNFPRQVTVVGDSLVRIQ
ncbi:TadE/TadG family type IV pilus assembly protein [Altererythrobacter arenosus]|uniref:TadE/TadG family type IV pilus assembly protein n=1 Tax=Altererythrobacter arenosus TaxID=3032592 RepID=A0ABY8FR75_9SPHN|nr:TadE/TadG family type IV pilus assembly protein [Altererythrobacter sp. CAU 1644]WFL76610.1 TadE/TadG family type IV pilus assembly protein [Altererythrobacter sp. CAU 1644]